MFFKKKKKKEVVKPVPGVYTLCMLVKDDVSFFSYSFADIKDMSTYTMGDMLSCFYGGTLVFEVPKRRLVYFRSDHD